MPPSTDLVELFDDVNWPRPIIEAALEGVCGRVSGGRGVARIDAQDFVIFCGDARRVAAKSLVESCRRPFFAYGVGTWLNRVRQICGEPFEIWNWTVFDNQELDSAHLHKLSSSLPPDFSIQAMDRSLASRAWNDVRGGRPGHTFDSDESLIAHGMGFCVLRSELVVAIASTFAASHSSAEIQIDTHSDYRRLGLATAVSAVLLQACLDRGWSPHWSAANPMSVALAEKLGFNRAGQREVLHLPRCENVDGGLCGKQD